MECSDDLAGQKASCPKCGQKVLIPTPPKPIPTPTKKTTLGIIHEETAITSDPIPGSIPFVLTVPNPEPTPKPESLPFLVIGAAVLLLIYGSFVSMCGCWEITYSMNGINELAHNNPAIMAAFDRHATGLLKIAFVLSVARFLSGFPIIGAGLFVMFRWPACRLLAFSFVLLELAIELIGRFFVVILLIPVANKIEAERAANQIMIVQPEFSVGTVLMVSQVIGTLVAVGIWAVFCVPAIFMLTREQANKVLGGRFSWRRLI